ncbi:nitrite reductase small subunit NirD [Shewanella sp. WXL01]|uniref:Nitrite reductase small subunit NirD n=1 Tax=Shewanella maritima TaxID=2520507 RepID=A0A411PCZ5_9GAMM|nr:MULTISPECIES: nitrite reductase small subunit NirD [Shewanella]NKF50623.1 nitrite reductase small subunit NirD [Shewanella sp. WXL01]QBF81388.1 nitrite reductase small subunit NirD [Shewanella maritima]
MSWVDVCDATSLPKGTGIAAWVEGSAVAIFDLGEDGLFALDNIDPATGVSLLARGLVCDMDGKLCVASPLYKHHYQLSSGVCLEDDALVAKPYQIKNQNGKILIKANAQGDV